MLPLPRADRTFGGGTGGFEGLKAKAIISKLRSPLGFALAWPFFAWIIFSIIGVHIIDGQLPQPDTFGGVEIGSNGYKAVYIVHLIPGATAMLLISRKLVVNIAGLIAYGVCSTVLFYVLLVIALIGWIPNFNIFIDS